MYRLYFASADFAPNFKYVPIDMKITALKFNSNVDFFINKSL